MDALHVAVTLIWGVSAGLLVWGTVYTVWRSLLAPLPVFRDDSAPAVSILKPLCGKDPGLLENLDSFLRLDYPKYEVIFFVADPLDPVMGVLE